MFKSALCFSFILLILIACQKTEPLTANIPLSQNGLPENIDSFLYNNSNDTGLFRWYRDDSIRHSSTASPHKPFFRVRFNFPAYEALTDSGRLPKGAKFRAGSMVVKELFDSINGKVQLLAILYKDSANVNSNKDWIWAEMKANGGDYISAKAKGNACVGCHSQNSRDYLRVFDAF